MLLITWGVLLVSINARLKQGKDRWTYVLLRKTLGEENISVED